MFHRKYQPFADGNDGAVTSHEIPYMTVAGQILPIAARVPGLIGWGGALGALAANVALPSQRQAAGAVTKTFAALSSTLPGARPRASETATVSVDPITSVRESFNRTLGGAALSGGTLSAPGRGWSVGNLVNRARGMWRGL